MVFMEPVRPDLEDLDALTRDSVRDVDLLAKVWWRTTSEKELSKSLLAALYLKLTKDSHNRHRKLKQGGGERQPLRRRGVVSRFRRVCVLGTNGYFPVQTLVSLTCRSWGQLNGQTYVARPAP